MSNPSGEDVLSARTSKSNYCPECTVPYGTLNDLESAEQCIAALEALNERLYRALSALTNAVIDAMESLEEAASWAETGDMNNYIRNAKAALAPEQALEDKP